MPNLREKTWTPTTPAKTEDANFWEDHLIDDESYEGLQNLLEGGGAGHEIQDADGNTMPQQPVIQFINAEVTNGDGKTIVSGNGQRGPKGDPGDGVPSGGTAGQYLQKTATGTAWAEVDALPGGGTAGQVLTKTATGAEWANPAGGDVQSVNNVTPDTNGNVAIDAVAVPYSNTSSGLTATNVQSAIDETSRLKMYSNVTQLGLTSGSATLAAAIAAMSDGSVLVCNASQFAPPEVPNIYGVIELIKINSARCALHFYAKYSDSQDYRMYFETDGTPTGTWLTDGPLVPVRMCGTSNYAQGATITLNESIANFSQLLFQFGTPSSTSTGYETVAVYPWQYGDFAVGNPNIGLTVNGEKTIITVASLTQLTYTTGSLSLRNVFGIRK